MGFLLIAFISAIVLYLLNYLGRKHHNYFNDKGVKFIKPPLPFLGSSIKLLFQKESFNDFLFNSYAEFPGEKYIGMFDMQNPMIFMKDLDIIKQFAIKDFDHFMNHRNIITEDFDTLFANSLVSLQGEKWKEMRATLSPAFTSAKMRGMFHLIDECARNVGEYYSTECRRGKGVIDIEVKEALSRFTNDVIATTAYGIKIDSFNNKENDFYKFAQDLAQFGVGTKQILKFIGIAVFPRLMKLFNVKLINQEASNFFREIVTQNMELRERDKIVRNDMINILIEAKKGSLKYEQDNSPEVGFAVVEDALIKGQEAKRKWTDTELVAQAFLFFLAGFDTVSTCLTFFFYEMVCNPNVQKRLQKEIDNFNDQRKNLDYNSIQDLKYLDMCISETLRRWPPAVAVDRVCTKPYDFPPPNDYSNQPFRIRPGEVVWIPIIAIHHDPKYYQDPERFDPERFSEENKGDLNPMAFIPFGVGPRNCIGSRFALMEVKIIIFHLLSRFDVVINEKTQIPLDLDKKSFTPKIKGGLHVGFKLRNSRP